MYNKQYKHHAVIVLPTQCNIDCIEEWLKRNEITNYSVSNRHNNTRFIGIDFENEMDKIQFLLEFV